MRLAAQLREYKHGYQKHLADKIGVNLMKGVCYHFISSQHTVFASKSIKSLFSIGRICHISEAVDMLRREAAMAD